MDARIKLAEAMGWKWDKSIRPREDFQDDWMCWIKPNGEKWYGADAMPDPFNDANDDYAVLEWVRENRHGWKFNVALNDKQLSSYEIGDYARAALQVLEGEKGV